MKKPEYHWCLTCDLPGEECDCGDTANWKWSPPLTPFRSSPQHPPPLGQVQERDAVPVQERVLGARAA